MLCRGEIASLRRYGRLLGQLGLNALIEVLWNRRLVLTNARVGNDEKGPKKVQTIRGFLRVFSGVECGLCHLVSMSCVALPKCAGSATIEFVSLNLAYFLKLAHLVECKEPRSVGVLFRARISELRFDRFAPYRARSALTRFL
jgi:hypothetical protein